MTFVGPWPLTSRSNNCFLNSIFLPQKTIIWPWGQRSKSHEGHYGTRHTALWSCNHIPNIIDLSGKTKKVMVRTSFAFVDRCLSICPFSFGHCVVCSFSIDGFWLPLWNCQTLLFRHDHKRKMMQTMSPFVRRGDIIIITIFDWNQNLIGYDISLLFFMSRSCLSLE
jgi:hypothetical protein